jgi:TonB family protein
MVMRTHLIALTSVVLLLGSAPRVSAQESLDAARALYSSAEYDSALTMLDGLLRSGSAGEDRHSIEMYRVLCLVAMRRDGEARGAIETLVVRNPLYRPSSDLPPRIRNVYDETRRKVLPSAVQARYQEAKTAYDAKDYVSARKGFSEVLEVLADPDMATAANQPPLADVRTLATGFEELSAKAIVPSARVAAAPEQPTAPVAPAPQPPPPAPRVEKIYSLADANVVPPITINQKIPAFPERVRVPRTGVVEVLIDGTGTVETATMIESVTPQIDRLTLAATRSWQYQPATVNGVPVKFLKRIQVSVVPSP